MKVKYRSIQGEGTIYSLREKELIDSFLGRKTSK